MIKWARAPLLAVAVLAGGQFILGCAGGEQAAQKTDTMAMDHAQDGANALAATPADTGNDDHGGPMASPATEPEIDYWTCVMHPSVHASEPSNCPVCKMDLIPVTAGSRLRLTEAQKALIPIRTEPVGFAKLAREIRTVGILDYDETRLAYASTRLSGWVEDLHVDFTGIRVREGDELLTMYSPELVAAQDEYLTAIQAVQELADSQFVDLVRTAQITVDAARSKLELLGLTAEQIDEVRDYGRARTSLPLYAPASGTVIHLNVANGQHVNRGANLYRIADLSNLWILADVYEHELPWIFMGQDVAITSDSMPGLTFHGGVTYIFPYLDAPTRTQKVKIEVANPDGQLRPGMYVTVRLRPTLADIYARGTHPTEPYACPMHPWVTAPKSGTCTICGMDLEPTRPLPSGDLSWTCPMHPEVVSDNPGECPICGMDLVQDVVPIGPSEALASWTCPMHPEVVSDEPGECPLCGMDLVQGAPAADSHNHAAHDPAPQLTQRTDLPALQFRYECLDHPDEYATAPGSCPIDGQSLVMTGEVLAVPKSAVIDTGLRQIVFVDRGDDGYEQVEVKLGPEAWAEVTRDEQTERRRYFALIEGVRPRDMLVTNGNFLLDSQTQLTGSAAGAYGGALGGEKSDAPAHRH